MWFSLNEDAKNSNNTEPPINEQSSFSVDSYPEVEYLMPKLIQQLSKLGIIHTTDFMHSSTIDEHDLSAGYEYDEIYEHAHSVLKEDMETELSQEIGKRK